MQSEMQSSLSVSPAYLTALALDPLRAHRISEPDGLTTRRALEDFQSSLAGVNQPCRFRTNQIEAMRCSVTPGTQEPRRQVEGVDRSCVNPVVTAHVLLKTLSP